MSKRTKKLYKRNLHKKNKRKSMKRKSTCNRKVGGDKTGKKAGILLYDNINRKVLTVSNAYEENIGLPKGSIEYNEIPLEAAFRELEEETGIVFQDIPKIVNQFFISKIDTIIFVILFPNGSNHPINFSLPGENIYNIKWRTKEELLSNINKCNRTIRSVKNNLIGELNSIFSTNISSTVVPLILFKNENENTSDIDMFISSNSYDVK